MVTYRPIRCFTAKRPYQSLNDTRGNGRRKQFAALARRPKQRQAQSMEWVRVWLIFQCFKPVLVQGEFKPPARRQLSKANISKSACWPDRWRDGWVTQFGEHGNRIKQGEPVLCCRPRRPHHRGLHRQDLSDHRQMGTLGMKCSHIAGRKRSKGPYAIAAVQLTQVGGQYSDIVRECGRCRPYTPARIMQIRTRKVLTICKTFCNTVRDRIIIFVCPMLESRPVWINTTCGA